MPERKHQQPHPAVFPETNRLLEITDKQARVLHDKLNDRPRKCLGWRTPRELVSNEPAIVLLSS